MKKTWKTIGIVLCLAVLLYSGYRVIGLLSSYRESTETYGEMAERYVTSSQGMSVASQVTKTRPTTETDQAMIAEQTTESRQSMEAGQSTMTGQTTETEKTVVIEQGLETGTASEKGQNVSVTFVPRTAEGQLTDESSPIDTPIPVDASTPADTLIPQSETIQEESETSSETSQEATRNAASAVLSESNPSSEATSSPEPVQQPPIQVDFTALKQVNEDIKGWLYGEGTPIDYPVLQGEDNKQYLYRMADGRSNKGGSLFMGWYYEDDFSDLMTVIYGHNMFNDSMFGSLDGYKKQEYYDEHPYLYLLSPYGNFRLDVLSAGYVPNTAKIYRLQESREECLETVEYYVNKSMITSNHDLLQYDRYITLSTCAYVTENSRFIVVCGMVPLPI